MVLERKAACVIEKTKESIKLKKAYVKLVESINEDRHTSNYMMNRIFSATLFRIFWIKDYDEDFYLLSIIVKVINNLLMIINAKNKSSFVSRKEYTCFLPVFFSIRLMTKYCTWKIKVQSLINISRKACSLLIPLFILTMVDDLSQFSLSMRLVVEKFS